MSKKKGQNTKQIDPQPLVQNQMDGEEFVLPDLPTTRFASLRFRASSFLDQTSDQFQKNWTDEVDRGSVGNLVPVAIACGVLAYFLAGTEPMLGAVFLAAVVCGDVCLGFQNKRLSYLVFGGLCWVFVGMFAAGINSRTAGTPIIERQITGQLIGHVLHVDRNARGAVRSIIKPSHIEGISENNLPKSVRVSAVGLSSGLQPGDTVSGLARLQPVSGPAYPGGYDFSFFAWYDGIGGNGFFMGKPNVEKANASLPIWLRILTNTNSLRQAMAQRIQDAMPQEQAAIAIALITGNRTRIPENIKESLRRTGLAHVLAISGLHMALVTLTIMGAIRLMMAFFPGMALNFPVKKWAILVGFAGATFYLFLSGFGIATQRAWIMISVMLLAAILDRRALTMRSVAVAAMVILIMEPQSLFAPGFQMSFAAVAGLVAVYDLLRKKRGKIYSTSFFRSGFPGKITSYFGGLALTSLIAGMATMFLAAWHFHQIAPLGLLTNLLAMPIVALVIMPFALLSIVFMPFGFEALALYPVTLGIEAVVIISQTVEGFSPRGLVGQMPAGSLMAFALTATVLTVFQSNLRWLGLIIPVAVFPALDAAPKPDIIVSENGRATAIRLANGNYTLLYPRRNKFVTEIWRKTLTDGEFDRHPFSKDQCSRDRCIVVLPTSQTLHLVFDPKLLKSSCQRADLLIAPRLWWVNCRARKPDLILTRDHFEQFGTHAIFLIKTGDSTDPEISVKTALPKPTRPWHRRVTPKGDLSDTAVSGPQVFPAPLPGQG